MIQRLLFLWILFIIGSGSASAQLYPTQYRPPNQQWQQLDTSHFKLIYSEGNDSTAHRLGQILEKQYLLTNRLVGGELESFPVILNGYNDRSNGFVTPFHFRSEIELPPIKGKSLNPQTGGWLENVGPHELVHAMQFSNLGDYNIPRLVSLFSPDLARSFHGAIPPGITEGLAVYHETEQVTPNGGRGHFPIFTNRFNAVFDSNQRWSMGQMLQNPSRSRPFNRHYLGGYEFTAWLQATFGKETSRKALDFYLDFPFLGYGVALRHATGLWPGQLHDRFEKDHEQNYGASDSAAVQPQAIPFNGRNIRRPMWVSDSTLVFYGSFYNARSGFYRYNLKSRQLKRLITTNSVEDYRYDIPKNRSTLIYSFYESDAIYDNTYKTELVEYDFTTGKSRQLTNGGRLYAPAYYNNQLLALQTRPASSALVSVGTDTVQSLLSLGLDQVVAVEPHPVTDTLAIVANKRGVQGLWIVNRSKLRAVKTRMPDISFDNGSVFDPSWHPSGKKLLFSSDFSGTHQLYEYDLKEESVSRLTNSAYNAFEGAYSPNGRQLAFIRQVVNERLPVITEKKNLIKQVVSTSRWMPDEDKTERMQRPLVPDSLVAASENWQSKPYKDRFGWLKPRTVLPVVDEVSNWGEYRFGAALHSNNLLQNQAYSGEATYFKNRLWYDLAYENKQFYPGFKARIYSDPAIRTIQITPQDGTPLKQTFLRQERSFALSVPLQYTLDRNIRFTGLFFEPEIRQSQFRYFNRGGSNPADFSNTTITNIFFQFNYNLRQNIRDLQPHSGWVFYSELEHYFQPDIRSFNFPERTVSVDLSNPTALRGGLFGYASPFRRWNQSLRVGVEGVTQSRFIFDNQSLVSDGFSEPVLSSSNNLIGLSARYTIPLVFADEGGFLLPLYLDNVYLVAFSNSITDPTLSDWFEQSRTVFGLELRTQFRISNLAFNFSVGYGFEPTRGHHQFFIGDF